MNHGHIVNDIGGSVKKNLDEKGRLIRVLLIELKRRCLDEIMTMISNDVTLLLDRPDHVGKALLRFYTGGMFKGHYSGAIVGAIAAQLEQRPTDPVTLRPVVLADRFMTKPATIARILERWRGRGLLSYEGRGRYIVTALLREIILSSQYQSFETDDLTDTESPYTLSIRSAARKAYTVEVLADWFGISRQSMHELCQRYGIEISTQQNLTRAGRRNTTEPDEVTQQNLTETQQNLRENTTEPDRFKKGIGDLRNTLKHARTRTREESEDHKERVRQQANEILKGASR